LAFDQLAYSSGVIPASLLGAVEAGVYYQ